MAGNDPGVAWATVCLAAQAMARNDTAEAELLAKQAVSMPQASPRARIATLICLSRQPF